MVTRDREDIISVDHSARRNSAEREQGEETTGTHPESLQVRTGQACE